MFVAENRNLNIRLQKPTLDHFIDAALFFYIFILFTFNHAAMGLTSLYYISYFLVVAFSFVKVLARMRFDGVVKISGATMWYAAILLLSLASALWADYPNKALDIIGRMIQIVLLFFCLSQTYATRRGVERLLKILVFAATADVLYIFANTPVSKWFISGLGTSATGQNANTISMIITVTSLLTLYLAYYRKQSGYYLFLFLQVTAVVLTSSRKSVLAICIGFVMLVFLKDKSFKLLFRMLLAFALLALVFYAIMNVSELYHAIGRRFESMINSLNNTQVDYSMYKRRMYMEYAKQFFMEHPILGNGYGSFSIKLGLITGHGTYSHNNYYEILVSFGMVGFLIYYGMYAYIIIKLIKPAMALQDDMAKLFLVVMTVMCVCEFAIVLYYQIYAMVFICAAFFCVCACETNSVKRRRRIKGRIN